MAGFPPCCDRSPLGVHPARAAGTELALSDTLYVGVPFGRGGARNSRARKSEALSERQVRGIIDAAYYAQKIGLPLNRHLTVHWGRMGIGEAGATAATGALLRRAGQVLRAWSFPFAYVWVRENDIGDGSKGPHSHIMMHVPPAAARQFVRLQIGWIEQIAGRKYVAGTLRTKRIGGRVDTATTSPEQYQPNLDRVIRYVLKGALKDTAAKLGLPRCDTGGLIIGKRAGWSENIGAAMRGRAVIVRKLHDELNAAVTEAYGWPVDLPPAKIVVRLIALNEERAAEEPGGHIRWLRPDYQMRQRR